MSKVKCPICERAMDGQGPKEWPDWPFCSRRCRLIDLGRWLGGEYRFPATPEEDSDSNETVSDSAVPSAVRNKEEAE